MSGPWDDQEVVVRGKEGTQSGVGVERVYNLGGGLVMEGFMGEWENFEFDAIRGWQPMKVLEDRRDVVTGTCVEVGSSVLNVFQCAEEIWGWGGVL